MTWVQRSFVMLSPPFFQNSPYTKQMIINLGIIQYFALKNHFLFTFVFVSKDARACVIMIHSIHKASIDRLPTICMSSIDKRRR